MEQWINQIMEGVDGIVILSGGLVHDENGIWRTSNFFEKGDRHGVVGDRIRIEAAAYLHRHFPEKQILLLGGMGLATMYPQAPKLSDVMEAELVALGVSPRIIFKDGTTGSTSEQVKMLPEIMKRLGVHRVALISNRYHLPRITTMMSLLDKSAALLNAGTIVPMEAEAVAIAYDADKWRDEVTRAYESEGMKHRVALEQKGIDDLKNGTYVFPT